jgi:hypothetical protein
MDSGSVKANIGHLEGASALASLVKCICNMTRRSTQGGPKLTLTVILEKGVIPPNALLQKMNPAMNADSYSIEVSSICVAQISLSNSDYDRYQSRMSSGQCKVSAAYLSTLSGSAVQTRI